MSIQVDIPQAEIEAFCKRHHIRRLALFGSVLREDFGPESDIDVLVEFEPGHTPGWEIVEMEDELSELLGREVDLRTPEELNPRWRRAVTTSAQVVHG